MARSVASFALIVKSRFSLLILKSPAAPRARSSEVRPEGGVAVAVPAPMRAAINANAMANSSLIFIVLLPGISIWWIARNQGDPGGRITDTIRTAERLRRRRAACARPDRVGFGGTERHVTLVATIYLAH